MANKAPPIFANNSNNYAYKYGSTRLDGQSVATPLAGNYPDGFHLLEFHHDAEAYPSSYLPSGNAFARDRTATAGGQRIAEYAAFSSALSEEARAAIRRLLLAKWIGSRFAGLKVAAGSTLELAHGAAVSVERLEVAGAATLDGDGSVVADRIVQNGALLKTGPGFRGANGGTIPKMAFAAADEIEVSSASDLYSEGLSASGGLLVKTGAGTVTAASSGIGFSSIAVQGGSLRFAPLETRRTFLHVDAASTASLVTVLENGTNFVTRWNDFNGNGRYAQATADVYAYRPNPEARRPFLLKDGANGHPVVDFGAFLGSSLVDESGVGIGYGAAMDWNERTTGIVEAFTVAEDREEVKELKTAYPTINNNGTPFIGDSVYCNYLRGTFVAGKNPTVVANNANAANVYNGTTYLDGVEIAPRSVNYGEGFHVLDFIPQSSTIGSAFARDRTGSFGGMRIAEALVFTDGTAEADARADITRALKVKWLGASDVAQVYQDVSVTGGSAFELPGGILSVSRTLTIAGVVKAERIQPASLRLQGDSVVDGVLVLGDGCELSVSGTVDAVPSVKVSALDISGGGTIRLLISGSCGEKAFCLVETDDVRGSAAGWSVVDQSGRPAKIKVREDGLYVDFGRPGLIILLK